MWARRSAARSTSAATPADAPSGAPQTLHDVEVVVVGDTAVLRAEVVDVVEGDDGEPVTFQMPATQVWVRVSGDWLCLAGHAGPRRT